MNFMHVHPPFWAEQNFSYPINIKSEKFLHNKKNFIAILFLLRKTPNFYDLAHCILPPSKILKQPVISVAKRNPTSYKHHSLKSVRQKRSHENVTFQEFFDCGAYTLFKMKANFFQFLRRWTQNEIFLATQIFAPPKFLYQNYRITPPPEVGS